MKRAVSGGGGREGRRALQNITNFVIICIFIYHLDNDSMRVLSDYYVIVRLCAHGWREQAKRETRFTPKEQIRSIAHAFTHESLILTYFITLGYSAKILVHTSNRILFLSSLPPPFHSPSGHQAPRTASTAKVAEKALRSSSTFIATM